MSSSERKLPFADIITNADTPYTFPDNSIAIVGAACRFPGANNIEELWDLISAGESRAEEVPLERVDIPASYRSRLGQDAKSTSQQKYFGNFLDQIDCFDNTFFGISHKEANAMDPQQRILLETAVEAMESSGYLRSHRRESGDPVGCFIGACFIEYKDNTCTNAPTAFTAIGTISAFLCGRVSYHFGWTGPSEVINTACSASMVAIHRACKAIQAGECPMALVGGVNVMTGVHNFLDLAKAGFLSPTGQCKPFDSAADGYCRGEGVGLVVLKPLSQAVVDGDQVWGVIPGTATTQGGLSSRITIPSSSAQVTLYQKALHVAGMEPSQISYIEAHGTGTQVGDPQEIASISEVFGESRKGDCIPIGSIKGNIGHLEVASGIAGLLKTLMMIKRGIIPSLASHKDINPKLGDLNAKGLRIPLYFEPWDDKFRAAMINSYGAAGSNAAALLCQGPSLNSQMARAIMPKNQEYPILLSAASRDSLRMGAATLDKYLKDMDSQIDIGDLAFTLSEKRAHLQFRWAAIVSDTNRLHQSLKAVETCFEAPQQPKRVVLAFSGQSTQTSGFERSLYESCPLIKHYIDHCNDLLKELRFPPIVPTIFNTGPVTDIVSHQCGIFAFQYALAKAWIDCGLQIDAVVGQSFGELTALAVSGVLSLEDGLKLVGTRAWLMQTKWGPDRGTMLAIHSTIEVVQDLVDSIPSGYRQIEIACYNAPTFQVVVGTDESVAAVEEMLKSYPTFNKIQHQRLDVSHGFHSRFTETIIEDLRRVANTMTFNLPKLPIETCTLQQVEVFTPDHIPRHTRNPVYFYHAVRRIEQRLGPCVWLEAGMNSPMIPLVKRALESPTQHVFEGLISKSETQPMSALCSIIVDLWREGISATFWNFKNPKQIGRSQIWLPPYQFEKTSHWMPYTDPVIEALRSGRIDKGLPAGTEQISGRLRLVSRLGSSSTSEDQFSVNTSTERFVEIVSGHTVLAQPVCPASLYMECAIMAVQLSFGSIETQALWFEDLTFDTPLGVDPRRNCSLTLKREEDQLAWNFFIQSWAGEDPSSRSTLHAKGRVGLTRLPQFQRHHMLVQSRIEEFEKKQHTECLKGNRAYKLFSPVVEYAPFMKGLSSIILGENEATVSIEVPNAHLKAGESTAMPICDAISLDSFLQALGLLINSSDHRGGDEAFLATSIESFSMALNCNFSKCRSWKVYTIFGLIGSIKARGDIYVFQSDGTMALSITGAQFTKIPIRALEKILISANQQLSPKMAPGNINKAEVAPSSFDSQSSEGSGVSLAFDSGSQNSVSADCENVNGDDESIDKIRTLIASYAGVPKDKIVRESSLAELGVDSLSALELAEEIGSEFSKKIDGGHLSIMTLREVCEIVAPAKEPKAIKETPTAPTQTAVTQKRGSSKGMNQPLSSSLSLPSHYKLRKSCKIETIAYKVVNDLQILSDIYYPNQRQAEPMPIGDPL